MSRNQSKPEFIRGGDLPQDSSSPYNPLNRLSELKEITSNANLPPLRHKGSVASIEGLNPNKLGRV